MLIDCPNCQREMYLSTRFDTSECLHCGHLIDDPSHFLPTRNLQPETHFQALQQMRRARHARRADNRNGEIRALKQAVHYNPQLIQAHIRLGRILPDERERRRHLTIARRIEPDNMEAINLLAEMQARLSPAEAAKIFGDEAPVKAIDEVQTQAVELQCPVCRAALRSNPNDGNLECYFCGYSERYEHAFITESTVRERLIETISTTQWQVGQRVMNCSNCSAQWAHESRLSTSCPYCNSSQIVVSDALSSFQPPDGVIPFTVTEKQALAAIQGRLKTFSEQLIAVIDPNAIKQAVLNAVYIPFWVFDQPIHSSIQTEFDVVGFKVADSELRIPQQAWRKSTYDLAVPAVKTIPSQLTQQLGNYYRQAMIPYQAGVLEHPAEIYEIPLNKAVIRARTLLSRAMSTDAARRANLMFTDFSQTGIQLVMAPVWLATLYEVDGEIRSVLVNGQTEKVILGQSRQPTA
jgi:hypothetical protein